MQWTFSQTTPMSWGCGLGGATPGIKTPVIPDEPDVLDDNDRVEGYGVFGWRRGRRVRRVVCGFFQIDQTGSAIPGCACCCL